MTAAGPIAAFLLLAACDQSAGIRVNADAAARDDRGSVAHESGRGAPGWAVSLGSTSMAALVDLVLTVDGDLVVTGRTLAGPDTVFGIGVALETPIATIVSRVDAHGTVLWTTALPGPNVSHESYHGLAVDSHGNIVVGSSFSGRGTFAGSTRTARGASDLYIAKLDPKGRILWTTTAGGGGVDRAQRIVVDRDGSIILTGTFSGTATFGPTTLTAAGVNDVLVARLSPLGEFVWATRAGGDADGGAEGEFGSAIALDDRGNLYVGAHYTSSASFEGASFQVQRPSAVVLGDGFVAKLDAHGRFVWATRSELTPIQYPETLALDRSRKLYMAATFMPVPSDEQAILCRLETDSGGLEWCKVTGCRTWSYSHALAVSAEGHSLLGGGLNAPCVYGGVADQGLADCFVAHYDPAGDLVKVVRAGDRNTICAVNGLGWGPAGEIYVAGTIAGTVTMGGTRLTAAGVWDGFVWKIPAPEP